MKTLGLLAGIAVALVALSWVGAAADDIEVIATIDPTVAAVGDQVTLVVQVKGKFRKSAKPELPQLDAFDVYEAGTSQSFSIVNGAISSSLVFNYVLVPKKEGMHRIEPITFTVGKKQYTANPVTVEVTSPQKRMTAPTSPEEEEETVGDDAPIFLRVDVDRDTVYVNQQITWTLGFYTDGRLDLLRTPSYTPPPAEGFWAEDLPPQNNYYKRINGKRYLVNELKRGLFPTAPGEYTIGSARVDVVIDDFGRRSFDDFFNRPFRSLGFGQQKSLQTDEIPVTVLPLPRAGRPATFSGLVGRKLDVSLRADKQVVQAGEPVNLTLEIEGEGNFKTMAAPSIPELDGFKIYESGSSSDLFKQGYVVSGRKTKEYVLIPKNEGPAVIPRIEMAYFDPVDKKYHTISTSAIQLDVKPGEQEEGRRVIFAGAGEDIEVLGHDINYIHPVPAVIGSGGTPIYLNRFALALHAIPLAALLLVFSVERRRRRYRDDVRLARRSRAARVADRKLGAAQKEAREGQAENALHAVASALREYIADNMNRSAAGLTTDDIRAFLATKNVEQTSVDELCNILRACDTVQYSPVAVDGSQAAATLEQARVLIKRIEKGHLS